MSVAYSLLFCVGLMLGADDPKDQAPPDQPKLNGAWRTAKFVGNGIAMPSDLAREMELVVDGDKFSWKDHGAVVREGRIAVDTKAKPWTIDFIYSSSEGKEERRLGIFEFDGSRLVICLARPDVARPEGFQSLPDTGHDLITYERK